MLIHSWEIFQFLVGITGMFATYLLKRHRAQNHFEEVQSLLWSPNHGEDSLVNTVTQEDCNTRNYIKPLQWISTTVRSRCRLILHTPLREAFLVFTCIGILPINVLKCIRAVENLNCSKIYSNMQIVEVLRNTTLVLFCAVQVLFLLTMKNRRCISSLSVILCAIIVSSNVPLGIETYINVLRESKTQMVKGVESFNATAEVATAFLKCSKIHSVCTCVTDSTMERLFRYTFHFPVEFAMLALCYLLQMWIWPKLKPTALEVRREDMHTEEPQLQSLTEMSSDSHCIIHSMNAEKLERVQRHIFCLLLFFILLLFGVFVSHIAVDITCNCDVIGNKTFHGTGDVARNKFVTILEMSNSYVLVALAAVGFVKVRQQTLNLKKRYSANDGMLILLSGGHIIFLLFTIVDFIGIFYESRSLKTKPEDVFHFLKVVLQLGCLYAQTALIIRFSKMSIQRNYRTKRYTNQYLIKCIVIFIGFSNLESWFVDKFLSLDALLMHVYLFQSEVRWTLNELLLPGLILFRLQTCLMCFEGYARFQSITSH